MTIARCRLVSLMAGDLGVEAVRIGFDFPVQFGQIEPGAGRGLRQMIAEMPILGTAEYDGARLVQEGTFDQLIGKDGLIYKKVTGGPLWDSPEHRELILRLLEQ